MQITLNQQEIEKAIIQYVGQQGIAITGKNVSVSLSAGRGENRMSATIEISNDPPNTNQGPIGNSGQACCGGNVVDEPTLPFDASEPVPEPEYEPAEKPLFGG